MIACRWRTFLVPALFALCLAGCAPKKVTIKGSILQGGKPMIVSEDTYVTLSFIPDLQGEKEGDKKATSYNARFDQKTGTYSVELPPGKYRTKLVMALPSKTPGKLNSPKPINSDTVYDLTKSQTLDVEVPAK
jgi:hypothetical protein